MARGRRRHRVRRHRRGRGPRPRQLAARATSRKRDASGGDCGDLNIAINPWTGYVANAYVDRHVAEEELGCKVDLHGGEGGRRLAGHGRRLDRHRHRELGPPRPDEEVHRRAGDGAQDAGPTGNVGIIGWYVPPWMAEEYPDITGLGEPQQVRRHVRDLRVRRQGPVARRRPVVRHQRRGDGEEPRPRLRGGRRRQRGGADQAFQQREENKKSAARPTSTSRSGSSPRWTSQRVALPPYEEGCDADPAEVDCDYPPYVLNKLISTEFAESGSPAVDLVKNFEWTNEDQNLVVDVHRPGRHVARGRRREVGRGEPGQGRRLARAELTELADQRARPAGD